MHANYYTAWKYVTKEDKNSLESEGHPDLKGSEEPSTMRASEANCKSTAVRRRSHENIEQDVDIDCSDECGQVQHESELKVAPYTLVQIYIDQCRIFADRQMF